MTREVVRVVGFLVKLGAYFLGFLCLMLMAACFLMAALAFPGEWITLLCLAAFVSSGIFATKFASRIDDLVFGKNGGAGVVV